MFPKALKSVAAAILALGLPVGACAQDVFDLNFQSPYIGPHVLNVEEFQPWIAQMKERTNGRLNVHFFQSGAIVKPDEVIPAIMNGTVDISSGGTTYQDKMFPYTMAGLLPFIAKDSRHSSELYYRMYERFPEVRKELAGPGHLMTIWGSDRSGFFSPRTVIKTPADLRGKRVLIWGGTQVDQVKAWGGVPVQVSPNDTYLTLQRGMGDVFLGPLPTGVANKLMEVGKEITVFPASSIFIATYMNHDVWSELPKDIQDLVTETTSGREASTRFGKYLYDATNRDIETMKAAGCTIHYLTDEEIAAWREASNDITMDYWIKDLTRLGVDDPQGWIKTVYELSDEVAREMGI